jgi:hypothetical protein
MRIIRTNDNKGTTNVSFVKIMSDGESKIATTKILMLYFTPGILGLTLDNITLAGARKVALNDASYGKGSIYSLAIDDISVLDGEEVTVTITPPEGYAVDPTSLSVVVYVDDGTTDVKFLSLTADGSPGAETSVALIMKFSPGVIGLTRDNISAEGVTLGEITDVSGVGTIYSLQLKSVDVPSGSDVTVTLTNPVGYNILPLSMSCKIGVNELIIPKEGKVIGPQDDEVSLDLDRLVFEAGGVLTVKGTRFMLNAREIQMQEGQHAPYQIQIIGKDGADGAIGARGGNGAAGSDGSKNTCKLSGTEVGNAPTPGDRGQDGAMGGFGGDGGMGETNKHAELHLGKVNDTFKVMARGGIGGKGGNGGTGGNGGAGGKGGAAHFCAATIPSHPGNGGQGGDGGQGGFGGVGGKGSDGTDIDVYIGAAFEQMYAFEALEAPAGAGGAGGAGGNGGAGGSKGDHTKTPLCHDAQDGNPGSVGHKGYDGKSGDVLGKKPVIYVHKI